ncbi:MAG: hypothetical protein R3C61_10740 [Bacteroidia bacterium]
MTYEQKEQQILSLIGSLPIFQRIRIALTILRGIAPEEIHPTVADEQMPWETEEFIAELIGVRKSSVWGKSKVFREKIF